ncbi:hypothetical protein LJK87_21585 [Paenibacillus sp. P25]|nr:hypothetical protein LJK87_21585 [Paenibacillus sp. P25]
MNETLLEVKRVKKYFALKKGLFSGGRGYVKAVDDVSFSILKGRPSVSSANPAAGRAPYPASLCG